MGLLIRSAVGLSLLFLVLPIDVGGSESSPAEQEVGPVQALFAARDAVRDIAGICERQPDVCATAKAALATIIARAKESVRLAGSLSGDSPSEAEPVQPSPDVPIPSDKPASPGQ